MLILNKYKCQIFNILTYSNNQWIKLNKEFDTNFELALEHFFFNSSKSLKFSQNSHQYVNFPYSCCVCMCVCVDGHLHVLFSYLWIQLHYVFIQNLYVIDLNVFISTAYISWFLKIYYAIRVLKYSCLYYNSFL